MKQVRGIVKILLRNHLYLGNALEDSWQLVSLLKTNLTLKNKTSYEVPELRHYSQLGDNTTLVATASDRFTTTNHTSYE